MPKNENFGISCEIKINQLFHVKISQEALQDINPVNKYADVQQQFEDNRSQLEQIIQEKIIAILSSISITTEDVNKQ